MLSGCSVGGIFCVRCAISTFFSCLLKPSLSFSTNAWFLQSHNLIQTRSEILHGMKLLCRFLFSVYAENYGSTCLVAARLDAGIYVTARLALALLPV